MLKEDDNPFPTIDEVDKYPFQELAVAKIVLVIGLYDKFAFTPG
jgi:hypothetical protein